MKQKSVGYLAAVYVSMLVISFSNLIFIKIDKKNTRIIFYFSAILKWYNILKKYKKGCSKKTGSVLVKPLKIIKKK